MRHRSLVFMALVALISTMLVAGVGQPSVAQDDKSDLLTEGTLTAGNGIYEVYVQNLSGKGVGQYTATTGSGHPAGSPLNVLFGGTIGIPGTSFTTIRSYTTGRDYVQDDPRGCLSKSSNKQIVCLDEYGTATVIDSTGVRTTYVLPGPSTTPDALTIIQDVNVSGSTFQNSRIDVTTTVRNNGLTPVKIGIRYLWDFQIGCDDGPTFQAMNPNGSVLFEETKFLPPDFESYRIEDNDVGPGPWPTFKVFGTVTGPAVLVPTPPDLVQYVWFGDYILQTGPFFTAFDYEIDDDLVIATGPGGCSPFPHGGGDTAVLYFFGPDSGSAITIESGKEHTVSASMFLTPPDVELPFPASEEVELDIKPGGNPDCLNINGNGVIPVAILGSADFDVTRIDVSTLQFEGMAVRVKGNGDPQCSVEDVSGDFTFPGGAPDGYDDLVCQFVDDPENWESGDGEATLTGELIDDTPFEGTDEICIVP